MKHISATKLSRKFGELFWLIRTDIVGIIKYNKIEAVAMKASVFKKLINRLKTAEARLACVNSEMRKTPANNVKS